MIGFGWVGDRRHDSEDLRGQRHRALMRAAMALALVFALLLLSLLLKDDAAEDALPDDLLAEQVMAPLPPPLVQPLEGEQEPAETAAVPPADESGADPAAVEVIDVEPATVARVEHPRPIMVENADTAATTPPPAAQPRSPAAQRPPVSGGAPARAAKPPAAERKAPAAKRDAPVGSGAYRVVIGDFLEPVAANKLCDKLMNTGYTLVMQHRVVVGPYAERSKAEAAISTLQREQQMRGMVVNAPEGGALMVQLGVFSEAANAQSMLSRLVAAGYPAQVHMRIMTSPFADKRTAESALTKLQQVGSVKGVVVAAP